MSEKKVIENQTTMLQNTTKTHNRSSKMEIVDEMLKDSNILKEGVLW